MFNFVNYNIGNVLEISVLNENELQNINRLSKRKKKMLERKLILLERIEGLIPFVVFKDEAIIFALNCKEKRTDIICIDSLTNSQMGRLIQILNL
jgi:hypothetical protein